MKKAVSKFPFFLILLPLFLIIHLEKDYHFFINYRFIQKEIIILFTAPIIMYALSRILLKSENKAALLSFALLFFFYFTGDIKDFLISLFPSSPVHNYKFLIPFFLLLLITLYFLLRKKAVSPKMILFLNLLTVAILFTDISFILFNPSQPASQKLVYSYRPCVDCEQPDIYYIIFDSYSSSPTLEKEFGFDNSAIQTYLENKGFFILKNSKSNYNLTPFCLASTMSLSYLTDIDTTKKYLIRDYYSTIKKVYESPLFPILEKQGYTIYNHSIFDIRNHPSTIASFDIWKTRILYQQHNIIRKWHNEAGWNFPSWLSVSFGKDPTLTYVEDRDRHDSITLNRLYQTIETTPNEPKMVYAHIFIPHSPYSYDSSGNKLTVNFNLSPEEDKQAYIAQLKHCNNIIKSLTDKLTDSTRRPSVVIIQGDHGYRYFNFSKKQYEFDNLNAIYLPEKYKTSIPDSVSGVNTFRFVLNTLFKQNYPLLETNSFFLKYK